MFNVLDDRLSRHGLTLQVHYLSQTHGDRKHWTGMEVEPKFLATTWGDIGPTLNGKEWHLNPGLIAHLVSNRPQWLMVGGPWDTVSGAAISLLHRSKHAVAWFEGNTSTPGRLGGGARRIKKGLLERFDYWAVPGKEGQELARLIAGDEAARRCVLLPNIVDERRFAESGKDRAGMRSHLNVGKKDRLAIWPARLIKAKGIIPFLSSIDPSYLRGWAIRILGDGPLRVEVQEVIARQGLARQVAVVPSLSYDQMPAAYAAADLFLLPSLHDPNPLSVVEALHSGLPILVSQRLGNVPEALPSNANGWSFDPTSRESLLRATGAAFSASTDELREAGAKSKVVAASAWASEPTIDRFLDGIGLPST
jgi:glycosyltransferase involved in cell wall biosynthesis